MAVKLSIAATRRAHRAHPPKKNTAPIKINSITPSEGVQHDNRGTWKPLYARYRSAASDFRQMALVFSLGGARWRMQCTTAKTPIMAIQK